MHAMMRERALGSLYFFSKAILGFSDLTSTCHLPLCNFIQDGRTSLSSPSEPRQKLVLIPRGHFKTTISTVAYPIWRIAHDPNTRILISNATSENAQKMLRHIKEKFMNCELLQWLFPEIIPLDINKTKWSDQEILLPREGSFKESSIETIGVGGKVTSRHFNLIIKDDLVEQEAAESPTVMRRVIDWHKYCDSLLDRPGEDEDLIIGTRWSFSDLYEHVLESEGGYVTYIKQAINEDGQPIFPERFSEQTLRRIRKKQGAYIYSCQYMNNPADPELADFDVTGLRSYTTKEEGVYVLPSGVQITKEEMDITMRIDPALDSKSTPDRCAWIVDGLDSKRNNLLLLAFAKKVTVEQLINYTFEFYFQFRPRTVYIELFAMQKILKHVFEQEFAKRRVYLPLRELPVKFTKNQKDQRIRTMQPYIQNGQVFIGSDMQDFRVELEHFPFGRTDDLLDAWSQGPNVWAIPDAPDEIEEQEEYEGRLLRARGRSTTGYVGVTT
jgi:phage terminase large subunit-like protein